MSEPTISADATGIEPARRRQRSLPRAARIAIWVLGTPCALLLLLYVVLLITPIRLPFGGETVRGFAQSLMPPTATLELGDMALALERGVWPVIQFAPVSLKDSKTGANVAMAALEVGFSPVRALFGQPGATISVVRPHVQVVQDLYGPRLTSLEIVEDPAGGPPTLRVLEGQDAFPFANISPDGIALGAEGAAMRSDNDWLIYNLEAAEAALADLVEQSQHGRFSKLVVRDGIIDMADPIYGLYRRISGVGAEIGQGSPGLTQGTFDALIGGRAVTGSLERQVLADGQARLRADVTNIDFSALLPFLDDAESVAAMRGTGALSIDVGFAEPKGRVTDGSFRVDLTGLDLRIGDDLFPVASSIMEIGWDPAKGQFSLADSALHIGQSSARIEGHFALGLDETYGPTIGIALDMSDVRLHPNDMAAPVEPFDRMEFSGWSAPLYGALGIDRFTARKGEAVVESTGRIDLLLSGLGIDMSVAGKGVSADDLKRLWPYVMGGESRDWFVENVTEGRVVESQMRFKFPVGSMALDGEDRPIPEGGMLVEMVGEGVAIRATETMEPIKVDGLTRLLVDDANVTISAEGGRVPTSGGDIEIRNPALVMDNSVPGENIIEISGDLRASIPAAVALIEEQQPDALAGVDLPVDLAALRGTVDLGLVATIGLADEDAGRPMDIDYVINGSIADFSSAEPVMDRQIANGQLAFSASQDGYQLGGTAEIDGMQAEVAIEGTPETEPQFRLGGNVAVADLAKMGFDASEFLNGQVRFEAQPLPDGAIRMVVDLEQAGLTIKDLGISKAAGTAGSLSATVRVDEAVTLLEDVALAFGTVRLEGGLEFHAQNGLVAAEFDTFALSAGDDARIGVAPMDGGYRVVIRGAQLDIKPMLNQFFGLGQGSGGVQSTQFDQTIALDAELDRVVGYYATTAFNLDLDLVLRGTDLRRATMAAQFTEGNAISITTNPAPRGRTLSVAFSDAGTVLRLLGVYSQLAGGAGSLVLTTDSNLDAEIGQLVMREFAIVDENNVAQVLGNHTDSRAAIAAQNRLDFDAAQVDFVRRDDRVDVSNAVLSGDTVGGTLRGFIYTSTRQYDLTGTYIPLFGLNNAFQQIPLLGPLLGGRDGEGLVGVTFAVRGPLDNPQFSINPLSILVPGAFRELFEFRARAAPTD